MVNVATNTPQPAAQPAQKNVDYTTTNKMQPMQSKTGSIHNPKPDSKHLAPMGQHNRNHSGHSIHRGGHHRGFSLFNNHGRDHGRHHGYGRGNFMSRFFGGPQMASPFAPQKRGTFFGNLLRSIFGGNKEPQRPHFGRPGGFRGMMHHANSRFGHWFGRKHR